MLKSGKLFIFIQTKCIICHSFYYYFFNLKKKNERKRKHLKENKEIIFKFEKKKKVNYVYTSGINLEKNWGPLAASSENSST